MNASRGYYSLIQYCPDLGKNEAANVGVLLFCPERGFLKALTTTSNARIRRFFRSEGHDWARINSFKKGLADRLEQERGDIYTLDDLRQFIALRANLLQITDPRPMKVTDPENDLKTLFSELITESRRTRSTKGLQQRISDRIANAGLDNKVRRDIRVNVPVLAKEIEIPFGFQNGRFNLINPVKFEASKPEQSFGTACKYAVEGRSLYEHSDPQLGELQLIVVGKFRSGDTDSYSRVSRVFEANEVRLFRTDHFSTLIDEIRRTGKVIEPS